MPEGKTTSLVADRLIDKSHENVQLMYKLVHSVFGNIPSLNQDPFDAGR